MQSGKSSDLATHIYQVRLPDWSWGLGKGPQITVDYFDTHTGRLTEQATHLPAIWQVPNTVQAVLGALAFALLVVIEAAIWRVARKINNRRRFYRQLRQANTPDQLRALLLLSANAKSLTEWQASMSSNLASDIAFQLNRMCFTPNQQKAELTEIKHRLRNLS